MGSVSHRLLRARARFERAKATHDSFVGSLSLLRKHAHGRVFAIARRDLESLFEMAFVMLFTAWEQFVETAFKLEVVEAPLSAFRSRHRVLAVDVETAHDLIRGSRRFVEWADAQVVRDRAKVFFRGGEPFESALGAIADDLAKMKAIRNRCVHLSQHAEEQYDDLLRRVFGSRMKMTPGALLRSKPPGGLSTVPGAGTYTTVFGLFGDILCTAARQIVRG